MRWLVSGYKYPHRRYPIRIVMMTYKINANNENWSEFDEYDAECECGFDDNIFASLHVQTCNEIESASINFGIEPLQNKCEQFNLKNKFN